MTSDIDTERRALQLFRQLLDLDASARAAFDAELEQTDPPVWQRVRTMLRQHENLTGRIERVWHDDERGPALPTRLGRFTLTRELGRGGMGVVARGEHEAEGFVQHVAIKWIPAWQIDAPRRARFLFERDVVARLRHPHIAQLVDGGEGEGGELWYAMELVEGDTLPAHCRTRRLDLRARVTLLLDLCDAVSHAHHHSILHRDIKPGNVLVTAEGQLKLIDFGIAKAIDTDAQELTHDIAPMTPRYAAPEQLRGERPTTATDQWQLGALAYEVLSGCPARQDGERGIPPASVRAGQPDAAMAAGYDADAPAVMRALRGDLDAILAKTLHEDPRQRYSSVAAVAQELRDWLTGRPLASRRHEHWYATRRFVAAHRWTVAFAALFVVALVAIALVSFVLGQRAREEARVAQRTAQVVSDMFLSSKDGRNLPSMSMSDFFTHLIETASADTELPPASRYRLLRDLAPRATEVGAMAAAEKAARGVLALAPEVFGAESAQTAQARDTLALIALYGRGRDAVDEMRPQLDEAERVYRLLGMENHVDFLSNLRARIRLYMASGDTAAMLETARRHIAVAAGNAELSATLRLQSRSMLASAYDADGQIDAAAREADLAVEEARALVREQPDIADMVDWLASIACEYHSRSNPDTALERCGALVAKLDAEGKIDSRKGHEALLGLCTAQGKLGKHEAALATCRRAERALIAVEGADSTSAAMATMLRRIGTRSFAVGRHDDAAAAQRRALQVAEGFLGSTHADTLTIRMELADSLLAAGASEEALTALSDDIDPGALAGDKRARWDALRARALRGR